MKYTESHEWAELENERATTGITNFAQDQLGEIVHVELPKIGQKIEAGEEIAVVESTKSAADIYAPLSGVITEINHSVAENPSLLNTAPESDGWLYKVEVSNPSELEGLLTKEGYTSLVQ